MKEIHMDSTSNLIPAWFTKRMAEDVWRFGLLMRDGTVIGVQAIESIHQAADGSIWFDVRLMDPSDDNAESLKPFAKTLIAPTSRLEASINASHIMVAFELADT
jgi:hypothetical protein